MSKKGGLASAVVALGGKPKPSDAVDAGGDPMGPSGEGLEVAAEEIIAACQSGDASALASALRAFIEQVEV